VARSDESSRAFHAFEQRPHVRKGRHLRQMFFAIPLALHLDDATQNTDDMRTRKQFMQHVMRILTRISLQDGERKLEAERLQRFLPRAQRQPGALDQRPLDAENHQRTTNGHGNRPGHR
jgi:hypothetical protein